MFYYCAATVLSTITCWLYGGLQNARDKKEKYLKLLVILNKTASVLLLGFASITLFNFFRTIFLMFFK